MILIWHDATFLRFCGMNARSCPCSLYLGPWRLSKFEVHSATKFFSGHADCTGGLVCVRDPEAQALCKVCKCFLTRAVADARMINHLWQHSDWDEQVSVCYSYSMVFLIFGQRYQWDPVGLANFVPDVTNAKHAALAVGPSCGISSERGGYGLGTLRVPCRSSSRRDLTRFMSLQCFLSLKLTIYRIYRTPWLSLTMRSFMVLPDDLSFQDFQAAIWSV